MSDQGQAQEKTEQPSQRRLDKARNEGQVARSRELNTVIVILSGAAVFVMLGSHAMGQLANLLANGIAAAAEPVTNPERAYVLLRDGVIDALKMLMPIMIGSAVAAIAAPVLLGGFTFSGTAIRPKLERLNPLQGLKRIVSAQGLMELVKTLLKFSVLVTLAAMLLRSLSGELLGLGVGTAAESIGDAGNLIRFAFIIISAGLLLIAAIDVPFVLWNHFRKLRMTRQELRDEHKETEGSPETKGRIRRVRLEMANRRMMQEVPKADVVLTNPTHYAVALAYSDRPDRAPRVVAKGKNLIAARIRDVASEHDVPVCESPLLTRAIFFNCELGDDIPSGLYLAVARVLVWVMNVRTAKQTHSTLPAFPNDLPVPADFRTEPGAKA
jgi:flagellar biosynthetic protein FlhB